jgi:hypothetical protein
MPVHYFKVGNIFFDIYAIGSGNNDSNEFDDLLPLSTSDGRPVFLGSHV